MAHALKVIPFRCAVLVVVAVVVAYVVSSVSTWPVAPELGGVAAGVKLARSPEARHTCACSASREPKLDFPRRPFVNASVIPLGPPLSFPNAREYLQEFHSDLPADLKLSEMPFFKKVPFDRDATEYLASVDKPFNKTQHIGATSVKCDVPCHFAAAIDQFAGDTLAMGQFDGKVKFYMRTESTANYPQLQIPVLKMRGFDIVSTYELNSDVPYPYISEFQRLPQQDPVPFNETIKAATLVVTHCEESRVKFVKALASRGVPIVSFGQCLSNTELPTQDADLPPLKGYTGVNEWKMKLIRPYALHLAFENTAAKDYVTEKVYESLFAGTIPVYRGAPNAGSTFLPDPESIVDTRDFTDIDALAAYLRIILTNETLWQKHHAWRQRPPQKSYLETLAPFVRTDFRCRICRLAYSKIHGIPWDPNMQTLRWPPGESPKFSGEASGTPMNTTRPVGRVAAW